MAGSISWSVYRLAREAECAAPDSPTSAGGEFLGLIPDMVRDCLESADDMDRDDIPHEVADGAVPIYTRDVWETFVDLAAYNEDPTELGADASDMEQAAKVALYMIAERCATAVLEKWDDDDDDND